MWQSEFSNLKRRLQNNVWVLWSFSAGFLPDHTGYYFIKPICQSCHCHLCGYAHTHQSITYFCDVHLTRQHRWQRCRVCIGLILPPRIPFDSREQEESPARQVGRRLLRSFSRIINHQYFSHKQHYECQFLKNKIQNKSRFENWTNMIRSNSH